PQRGHGARPRLSGPAPPRPRRLGWLRLAGRDLSEPVRHRPRHHRHRLEWSSVLCPRARKRRPRTPQSECKCAGGPRWLATRARNGRLGNEHPHLCPCKEPRMRKPKTIGVGYASLLERLSQTGSGLLSDCAPCGLLEYRAHRLPADQQGHRQSPTAALSPGGRGAASSATSTAHAALSSLQLAASLTGRQPHPLAAFFIGPTRQVVVRRAGPL